MTPRTESAKARSDAFSLITIDANLFTQYAVAFTTGNEELEKGLRKRFFRDEIKTPFQEWLALEPLKSDDALATPFQLDFYEPARLSESEQLEDGAEMNFKLGREANQTSENYVLATIFFAAVLFFVWRHLDAPDGTVSCSRRKHYRPPREQVGLHAMRSSGYSRRHPISRLVWFAAWGSTPVSMRWRSAHSCVATVSGGWPRARTPPSARSEFLSTGSTAGQLTHAKGSDYALISL